MAMVIKTYGTTSKFLYNYTKGLYFIQIRKKNTFSLHYSPQM